MEWLGGSRILLPGRQVVDPANSPRAYAPSGEAADTKGNRFSDFLRNAMMLKVHVEQGVPYEPLTFGMCRCIWSRGCKRRLVKNHFPGESGQSTFQFLSPTRGGW